MFKGRSVIEIMVLWFSFIVGFVLLAVGGMISVTKLLNPDADIDRAVDALFAAITIVLGALLGMLSVKGAAQSDLSKRPDEEKGVDVTERTE